ncbi:hypothetical protein CAEBREN_19269 [Caenorhabditis brenneri]|uniref:Skp1-related protein n=1 Tax=Caenorhabditis brenneri TaxID=135651 RepID=G0PMQ5_CAEBE|nr:hypothetical protein CAEBREN_19269 [Caenorhabditis brenneri]
MVKSPKSNKKGGKAVKVNNTVAVNENLDLIYTLISSDGEQFQADGHSLKLSKVLSLAAKCLQSTETTIHVEKVKGDTLKRVLEWCENHKDDGPYVSKCGPGLRLPHWDFRWLKSLDNQQLFDLITATNDLQMKQLMDYSCKTVANMAKGKSPEQLRQIFGILTDEEEAELALHEPGPSNAN